MQAWQKMQPKHIKRILTPKKTNNHQANDLTTDAAVSRQPLHFLFFKLFHQNSTITKIPFIGKNHLKIHWIFNAPHKIVKVHM